MKDKLSWLIVGIFLGSIGVGVLRASSGSDSAWTEKDVYRVIFLLEKIADGRR